MGKILAVCALLLFGAIALTSWLKRDRPAEFPVKEFVEEFSIEQPQPRPAVAAKDQISRLFALDGSKFPIVETVVYSSRVPWLQGRPAWIADYASHYETSRHFIARSINRGLDYFTQKAVPGMKFNVFRKDKKLEFHLLIDLSTARLWFYYYDVEANERVLLKTYPVGLGRSDIQKQSGYLTPVGTYLLGDKVAIYRPGVMGVFQDKPIEMMRVFGTRWMPFDQARSNCSEPARGLGIHGAPWIQDSMTGQLIEDRSKIGQYDSDGCIRLAAEDVEELFSIVITKPTYVHLVLSLQDAQLPGVEKQ